MSVGYLLCRSSAVTGVPDGFEFVGSEAGTGPSCRVRLSVHPVLNNERVELIGKRMILTSWWLGRAGVLVDIGLM